MVTQTLEPPTFADILSARTVLSRHLRPTPMLRHAPIEELVGTEVWVKHENHLPTAAFREIVRPLRELTHPNEVAAT